jgi:integrase
MANQISDNNAPNTENFTVERRYLTEREIERLIEAAKSNRHGHRDATMILVAYRHGLRASEVCDLQWHQIELDAGRLHVRRAKKGTPSVHPIRGDEIRALRKLRRENPTEAYVFVSERGGPIKGSVRPPRCRLRCIRTCCGTPAASSSPTTATIPGVCSTTSVTRISSTQCATPS